MSYISNGFQQLYNEVVQCGLCSMCGACTLVCPEKALVIDRELPTLKGKCNKDCYLCLRVCPQNVRNIDTLASHRERNKLSYTDVFIGRAANSDILKRVGSGGVCSATFSNMLQHKMIDAVATTQFGGAFPWSPNPVLTDDPGEVVKSGCPKYALSCNVAILDAIARSGFERVVFIGLPCQVEAVALIKMHAELLDPELRRASSAIICTVGIWCGNNFREIGTRRFIETMSIDPGNVTGVGYGMNRGTLCFYIDHNDGRTWAPFNKYLGFLLAGYIAPACKRCNRRSSYYGDLSIGGLQQPGLKWSSISVQTNAGLDLFRQAVECAFIEVFPADDPKTVEVINNR
ncbi:MAG: Coenzyme F420 hydrogenase/dehydrogenase, beta subunit C-terminal domain [Ignavibacteriales bacterium]